MNAAQIRALRESLEETQEEFGLRFGRPTNTVAQWETGRAQPDAFVQQAMKTVSDRLRLLQKTQAAH